MNLHANIFKTYKRLSRPEKIWVLSHPFVAVKTAKISSYTAKIAKEMIGSLLLDGDYAGGQVDAFRHGYWMASLAQQINWRKVLKLGNAHEKGNYIDYKRNKLEENNLPDSISCDQDYRNNSIGICIGRKNKTATAEELKTAIIEAIKNGDFWIIKKNCRGDFIDSEGNIVNRNEYKDQWYVPKYLVPSNEKCEE